MRISVDRENNIICVPCEELAHFARTRKRQTKLSFAECDGEPGTAASFSQKLSYTVSEEGVDFTVTGRADVIFGEGNERTLEIFSERSRVSSRTNPAGDPEFMARGVLLAYMLCCAEKLDFVVLRLTYTTGKGGIAKSFTAKLSESFLENMSQALFSRSIPFIEIEAEKLLCQETALGNLAFPYRSIRDAQREFIGEAYRAVKNGERLIVSAPTGVGKTISALYPSLRALGLGDIDKIFYLTAKTPTGKAAADACRVISSQVPTLRCITIIAKERLCPMSGAAGKLRDRRRCRICPLMDEVGRIPYEERRDSAVLELLRGYRVIDTETVQSTAAKYHLCPYELSLDVSEYCEVVICDYNYAFDPSVRFKRYFADGSRQEKYVFLVDEAHNLPDRAREMYSSGLDAAPFIKLYKIGNEAFRGNVPLLDGIGAVIKKLKEITALCRSEERLEEGQSVGCRLSSQMLPGLPEALTQFVRAAGVTEVQDEAVAALLEEAVQSAAEFVRSAMLFDKGFAFYCELIDGRLNVYSRCLDPSPLLNNMMTAARSVILFSATLTPMEYFADVLGCAHAACLELDSPYDPKNLCLLAFDTVSTRYADREGSYDEIAEVILAVCEAKEGNYMVYFPSYEFMAQVAQIFAEMAPDIKCIVQSRGMGHSERGRFLEAFSKGGGETLVGFCVLGGAFSEGVDLKGEKLIGAVIVGTGLPKMCSELNILSEYFEKTRECGKDYAYTYPAMIKVQQAAGRVIRSETDRGVVVLVDDRYAEPATYRLFPKSWRHIKYTGDPYSLNTAISRFWEAGEAGDSD